MGSVLLYHGSAQPSGVGPPVVSYTHTGSADLTQTDLHPAGEAVVTCIECGVMFDVHVRTAQELKAATRSQRGILTKIALTVMVGGLAIAALAVIFAAQHGGVVDTLQHGVWFQIGIIVMILGLSVMLATPFVRVSALKSVPRTKTSLHILKLHKPE